MNNEQIKNGEKKPDLIINLADLEDPTALQAKLQQEGLYQVNTLDNLFQKAVNLNLPDIAQKAGDLKKTSEQKLQTFNKDMAAAGVQFVKEEIKPVSPAEQKQKEIKLSPEEEAKKSEQGLHMRAIGELTTKLQMNEAGLQNTLANLNKIIEANDIDLETYKFDDKKLSKISIGTKTTIKRLLEKELLASIPAEIKALIHPATETNTGKKGPELKLSAKELAEIDQFAPHYVDLKILELKANILFHRLSIALIEGRKNDDVRKLQNEKSGRTNVMITASNKMNPLIEELPVELEALKEIRTKRKKTKQAA